jgi:peroxin-1
MLRHECVVRGVNRPDSFVALPQSLVNKLIASTSNPASTRTSAFLFAIDEFDAFVVAWGGQVAATADGLEIARQILSAANIVDGARVSISLLSPDRAPPLAKTLVLTPRSPDDWELIELHATDLEANLLTQLMVVNRRVAELPVWLAPSVVARPPHR